MALPSSGAISISQIRTELGSTSGSLRTLSAAAGKTTPDAMSEFYGYSAASCNITGSNVVNASNSSATGTAVIVGAKMIRFSCFGGASSGNNFSARLVINGTTYNLSCTQNQTKNTDIPFPSDGSYAFTLTRVSFSGSSGNNASVACL